MFCVFHAIKLTLFLIILHLFVKILNKILGFCAKFRKPYFSHFQRITYTDDICMSVAELKVDCCVDGVGVFYEIQLYKLISSILKMNTANTGINYFSWYFHTN